jgi:hypothetical protein
VSPGDINTARYGAGTGLRRNKGMRGFIVHNITVSKADLKRKGFDLDDYNRSAWDKFGVT